MKKNIAFLIFFAVFAIAAYQDMKKGHQQDQKQAASIQGIAMSDVLGSFL